MGKRVEERNQKTREENNDPPSFDDVLRDLSIYCRASHHPYVAVKKQPQTF